MSVPAPGNARPARWWSGRPWARRTAIGAGVLLALVLLVAAFASLALPRIVKTQAERAVAERLHRKLVIDTIEIHPFTLAASIGGLRLYEADGSSEFLSFERLDVRLSTASVWQLAPVVREIHLVGPRVRWVRTAPNQYSTDDIVAALAAAGPAPPAAPAPAAPPRFSLNNIRIEGGSFRFDDVPTGEHHAVEEFTLGIPFLSTFASQEDVFVEPRLGAVVDGAPLKVAAEAKPFAQTREFAFQVDFDKIELPPYMAYLPGIPAFRMPSGRLDLHLKARAQMPPNESPALTLSGAAHLEALALTTPKGKPLLKLATVDLTVDKFRYPAGPVSASVTLNGKGRVAVDGDVDFAPLQTALDVQVEDLDLLPVQPLFADRVNLRMTRAGLAAKGKLHLAQDAGGALLGDYQGDVAVNRLATIDSVNANDFVNWDTLALRGVQLRIAPFSLHVDQLALENFYARVILYPDARLNLQDVVRGRAEAKRSLTEANPSPPAETQAAVPAQGAAAKGSALPPISIGKIVIGGGQVRYTDNFIKPRYTAELLGLAGTVSGLSTDSASGADVDLHGTVNDAPLLIGGKVNPLARDLALDVKASVHGMELAPLSAYSGKYVGYGIERGKISFDVSYKIENRKLEAQNRLVLDQLTFGQKIESASAIGLPVQLAVALLQDRNGVIDIDLPIGGSLDDPEFSVGGLLVKVLVNLITKAVAEPFALLGKLFGGGSADELSQLAFAPGQSAISGDIETKLRTLAKALAERPGLHLDITGWADPGADRDALRQQKLDARIRALKRQDMAARGTLVKGSEVAVAPEEYPALLALAYRTDVVAAQAPAKPGDAAPERSSPEKAAPPTAAAMEQALRAAQAIGDDDLAALGNRRAQAAEQWLGTIGGVAPERMSLVAAKIAGAGDSAPAKPAPSGGRVVFDLH